MIKSLKDKVILISGDVNILSMEMIQSFLKEKAIVIFPAKSLNQIDTIKAFGDIKQHENLITLLVDVQDFDKVKETCEIINEKFGKIDIAIEIPKFSNCPKALTEASLEEWENMIESDMVPFFIGARIVINSMKGNTGGMFVHVTDSRFFENIKSCALARVAFTARMEMSKIFAEEAQRSGIRYYHIWANHSAVNEASLPNTLQGMNSEMITAEIMSLYQNETYNTEMALQSFPGQLLHQPG